MNTINLTIKQLSLLVGVTITVSITLFSGGLFSGVSLRSHIEDTAESATVHRRPEKEEPAYLQEQTQAVSSTERQQPDASLLPETAPTLPYIAQIAIFTTEERALVWVDQFEGADFQPRLFTKTGEQNKTLYAVVAGFYDDRKSAGEESERFFSKFSIKPFVTTSEKLGREIHYRETAVQTLAAIE